MLVAAALAARSCASSGDLTSQRATEIARSVQAFEPDDVQVRYVRRGVGKGIWAVSLYKGTARRPTRIQLVVVDAGSGEIVDDGR